MRTLILLGIILLGLAATYVWEWWVSRRKLSPAELMEAMRRSPSYQETVRRLMSLNSWEVKIEISSDLPLTAERLAAMASAAFGRPFIVRIGELDAIDAAFLPDEQGDAQVAGAGPGFYVALAPNLFEVVDLETEDGRLRTFRYTASAVHIEELPDGFRWTGKLAAQALAGTQVSVTLKGARFPAVDAARAAAALCSDDPHSAFQKMTVEG